MDPNKIFVDAFFPVSFLFLTWLLFVVNWTGKYRTLVRMVLYTLTVWAAILTAVAWGWI